MARPQKVAEAIFAGKYDVVRVLARRGGRKAAKTAKARAEARLKKREEEKQQLKLQRERLALDSDSVAIQAHEDICPVDD